MIARLTKTALILVVLLISIQCKTLATIYYVNINNTTPGAGTSWATAFKDLNQALAAATGVFDQIWVAKGTYYPTTTTSRTATFTINYNAPIYGGFNGTETAYTQANPTANPTILSGDIGTPGDPTDNSYHVVTYTAPTTNTNLTMDGFTITGGNANQGYPGSTTPAAGNIGGGFLEISTNTYMVSAAITHCNFTNNFAVYGAGFGVYGDASTTFYSLIYCNFSNNTAYISGGAAAAFGNNSNWNVSGFDMCVFTNNASLTGQASVITTVNSNSTTTYTMLTEMYNCIVYNNPEPQFNGQTNSAPGSLQVYNTIVWTSGAPYAGPLKTGNAMLLDWSDLDEATPGSGNINADPQFVNAPGGNYHVAPCSPVIDAGFYNHYSQPDPDGNPRQINTNDIGLYESTKPAAAADPTVGTPPTYCLNATAAALTATGQNLLWYTSSTGGTGVPTAPTPTTNSVGSTNYYVTQTPSGSCESSRQLITVTINAAATDPTVGIPPTYCLNATASALTATGQNLLWYTTSTGGTGTATAPTPLTTSTGTQNYYVSQTPTAGCESARTPVTVTINPPAANPVASPANYCLNTTASPLQATGANLLWYTTATGGTGSSTAPTPPTTTAGTTTWYVTQTPATCESSRTPVTVTIGSPAIAPTATPQDFCQNSTASPLTAIGSNLLWYTTATGGTGSSTAPTPPTTTTGTTTWYVTQTPASSCESPRTPVDVTINANPKVTITTPNTSVCPGADLTLQAEGAPNFQWSPVTNLSNPAVADPVVKLQSNITYIVTGTDANGCTGTAQIILDISTDCNVGYNIPDAFTPNGDGKNDAFRVRTGDVPQSSSLMIFNRFGGKVFESSDINAGWNGTVGGNKAPAGVYVYTFQATTSTGTPIKKQGTIILIR